MVICYYCHLLKYWLIILYRWLYWLTKGCKKNFIQLRYYVIISTVFVTKIQMNRWFVLKLRHVSTSFGLPSCRLEQVGTTFLIMSVSLKTITIIKGA